jgi:hypothetical protein
VADASAPRGLDTRSMNPHAAVEVEPLDEAVDHVRGPSSGHLILEYGAHALAARLLEAVER